MEKPKDAKEVLSSKGAKLRTHGMHIRRSANKGYIVSHDMRDQSGKEPMDGQSSSLEYALAGPDELAKHVSEHMGPEDAE